MVSRSRLLTTPRRLQNIMTHQQEVLKMHASAKDQQPTKKRPRNDTLNAKPTQPNQTKDTTASSTPPSKRSRTSIQDDVSTLKREWEKKMSGRDVAVPTPDALFKQALADAGVPEDPNEATRSGCMKLLRIDVPALAKRLNAKIPDTSELTKRSGELFDRIKKQMEELQAAKKQLEDLAKETVSPRFDDPTVLEDVATRIEKYGIAFGSGFPPSLSTAATAAATTTASTHELCRQCNIKPGQIMCSNVTKCQRMLCVDCMVAVWGTPKGGMQTVVLSCPACNHTVIEKTPGQATARRTLDCSIPPSAFVGDDDYDFSFQQLFGGGDSIDMTPVMPNNGHPMV